MFCSNCGAKLEDDAKFCSSCGTKVKIIDEVYETANEKSEEVVSEEPFVTEIVNESLEADEVTENVQSETQEVKSEIVDEDKPEEEVKEETKTEKEESETVNRDHSTFDGRDGEPGKPGTLGVFDFNDTKKTAIQAVAFFFALSFFGHFTSNFFGGIGNVVGVLGKMFRPLSAIFWLLTSVLRFAVGASSAGIIVTLLVVIFKWDTKKSDKYLLTVAELGVFVTVVSFLRSITLVIYNAMATSGTPHGQWNTFWSICGTSLLMIGAFYGLSVGFNLPAFKDLTKENLKGKAIEAPIEVYTIVKNFCDEKKEEREVKRAEEETVRKEKASKDGGTTPEMSNEKPFIPLKTDRSFFVYFVLSIVTCGIYQLFFFHNLAQDVNTACDGDGEETQGILALILLSLVTCGIYTYVWYYKLGNRLQTNANRYGFNIQENGTTLILWMIVGSLLCGVGPLVAMYLVIKNTNLICAAYNNYNYNN